MTIFGKLTFLMLILPFGAFAQVAATQQNRGSYTDTINSINAFASAHPIEKTYLHLNKQRYIIGDTIWFKAYTVVGGQHQLSALSGVLYVELIGQKDSVLKRLILHLVSGLAGGDFDIPSSFKPGTYHIRAYTNWMRNAGPDYFYNQQVQIGGLPPLLNTSDAAVNNKPDVQFFPEGGQLVYGLRSKVAVKSVAPNGLGEDIFGVIVDNDGNEVSAFSTQHLGMGVFALTPQEGKTYKAQIKGLNQTFVVDLPKPQDEGFILAVNNKSADSVYVKIAVNEKLFKEKLHSTFYIIAHAGGKVYYTSAIKLETQVFSTKIEKKRFPSGIVQFTLFSPGWEPLNERIAFIQNSDTLKLKLSPATNTFIAGQNVKIDLDAKNADNQPVVGSFSVSVINEDFSGVDEINESTILNNLLLTSDLKGHIEKPNYYFLSPNDQTKADLDVLMLTQGYRKFDWKAMLDTSSKPITYKPEKLLHIKGSLKTPSGKPVPDGKISLVALKENMMMDTTTDASGNFKFTGLNFSDTAKLILRAQKKNNSDNVIIAVNEPDYPALKTEKFSDISVENMSPKVISAMQKDYTDNEKRIQANPEKSITNLKEVNIRAQKINSKPNLAGSSNLNGAGNADQVIMGDKVEGCVTLSDCLQGKVFGVTFRNGVPYSIRAQNHIGRVPSMAVIIDGILMSGSHLNDVNSNDIYSIEVLRSGAYLAIYGSNTPGGALVITTKRGAGALDADKEPQEGTLKYSFNGFYKARQFYSPKYTAPVNDTKAGDFRNSLYWNADIITDKNGKASFDYFNSASRGIYRIEIEGIDGNGNLGREVYHYKVE